MLKFLTPLLLITLVGCNKIQELNDLVNSSTYAIYENTDAVNYSTDVIQQNGAQIDASTQTMRENKKHLEDAAGK